MAANPPIINAKVLGSGTTVNEAFRLSTTPEFIKPTPKS